MRIKLASPLKSLAILLAFSFVSLAATSAAKKQTASKAPAKKSKTRKKSGPVVAGKKSRPVSKRTVTQTRRRKGSARYTTAIYNRPVSVAYRTTALQEVTTGMAEPTDSFINARALVPFFEQLYRSEQEKTPIHILQFGDSHTASDDWVNTMRQSFQARFGSGGPGFAMAGHPYRGYRRFDISGANSSGWQTDGTVGHQSDGRYGLGGVSLTANSSGETVTVTTEGDVLKLCYLQQPGGGSVRIDEDGAAIGTVSTAGELDAGFFEYQPKPGQHTYTVTTLSRDPVRLFGWISQKNTGLTFETLGINGAQANMLADWDEKILAAQIEERNPAMILLAYGTNEALSPKWDAVSYKAALLTVIERLRKAAPAATIALVGPPDCFLRTRGGLIPFPHLEEVIRLEKEVCRATGCAFWDWRERMGGAGSKKLWVQAGLSQGDYVHLTPAGYQVLGNTIFSDLMEEYRRFLAVRVAATSAGSSAARWPVATE